MNKENRDQGQHDTSQEDLNGQRAGERRSILEIWIRFKAAVLSVNVSFEVDTTYSVSLLAAARATQHSVERISSNIRVIVVDA